MKIIRLPKGAEICFLDEEPNSALNAGVALLGPHKKWAMYLGISYGPPIWWRWRLKNEHRHENGLFVHDLEAGWLMLNLGFAFARKEVVA